MRTESLNIEGSFADALGENSLADALVFGRLIATVCSKRSGQHVTVRARAMRRENGSESLAILAAANRIKFEVPAGGRGVEIGELHLEGNHAGEILPPWGEDFDGARLWAARHVLEVALDRRPLEGEHSEILLGASCLICGHPDMSDPESVKRGIGRVCRERAAQARAQLGKHVAPATQRHAELGGRSDLQDQLQRELAVAMKPLGMKAAGGNDEVEVPDGLIHIQPNECPREVLARTGEDR